VRTLSSGVSIASDIWSATTRLLTGTGVVPDESFTLRAGDVVRIAVDGIGVLENPVVTV
jgi:2-keto-4-pentenoate hydratase/2-oxohepta-3-ene-1,7-dioic acid hydratase in catechol pathway